VPTLKEVGIDMPPSFNSWIGMFAPAGVPADIIRRLNVEMVKVMNDPGFKARIITATGLEADDYRNATPAEFANFIKEDREVIIKAAAAAGIRKPAP
jgi:tripartite-type tricarboxylate transporter receptor subunit TctC